jgi:hypothetical protein
MKKENDRTLSRRVFTQRAALLSATATVVPVGMMLPTAMSAVTSEQVQESLPKLSPEGQAEADARFQLVLSRYGNRLSEEEKRSIKTMCYSLQATLARVRTYPLKNGDGPALFLKPLVDRDNKTKSTPAKKPAESSANKS